MSRRILLFASTLLVFLLIFSSGCNQSSATGEVADVPQTTLRVAYGEWPPDLIVYLAEQRGYFSAHGADVELVQISGFEELFELIESGDIDIWPVTLLDAVIAYAEGEDWQVIMLEDFSEGADAVVTLPENEIKKVSDLAGKTVGVEQGTVGEFFLQILLTREDLTLEDVTIVDLAFDEIPPALARGEIDAGVTYEPSITEVLDAGGEVLVNTEKERNVIVDVYAADKSRINDFPNDYKNFMKGILDASEYYNDNPDEAIAIMAEPFGNSPEELTSAFEGLKIPNLRDNTTAFNRASGFAAIYPVAQQAQRYLEDAGLIVAPKDLSELFADVIDLVE